MSKAFHPFLLGLYPVLFLMSRNWELFRLREAAGTILVILTIVCLMWALVRFGLKWSWKQSALIVSLVVFLFFSYSHLYELLAGVSIWGVDFGHHRFLLPLAGVLFALGLYLISKVGTALDSVTRVLNFFSLLLVLLACAAMLGHSVRAEESASLLACPSSDPKVPTTRFDRNGKVGKRSASQGSLPDIYYIILDGYGRADILKEYYRFDNGPFVRFLEERGFFVAGASNSNYCQTLLSLGSSLNMCYLDTHRQGDYPLRSADSLLASMVRNSRVFRFLRQAGYETVAFSTGLETTEIRGADRFEQAPYLPTHLQFYLVARSPMAPLIHSLWPNYLSGFQRKRILYALKRLARVARLDRPTFVFCHIICPHPPFVFSGNGEPKDDQRGHFFEDGNRYHQMRPDLQELYRRNYVGQVSFLNRRLEEVITAILARSKVRPIIVLQGDHGPRSLMDWESPQKTSMRESMGILNAYLVPEHARALLYRSVTPVNTFRIIFNGCFGTDLKLLEDRSFFSLWYSPLSFIDVTKEVRGDRNREAERKGMGNK